MQITFHIREHSQRKINKYLHVPQDLHFREVLIGDDAKFHRTSEQMSVYFLPKGLLKCLVVHN